jgi:pSer/pThr/pTyr-binding forkhead associated (FHA) protein
MDENKLHTIVLPTVTPSSGSGQKPKLLVTAGPLEGREYMILKFPYTIGSGLTNELSIADSTVSRRHCEITLDESGALVINDLGSTNGTAIEGVKVSSARLSPNTEVQLGRTRIIVPLVQDRPELTMSAREQFGKSIGRTPLIRHVFHLAEQAAASDSAVLILGESGTGKEELAEVIGLKKYLNEFTLIAEREITEVSLWKEYMVYATLFGIADKVLEQFKKVYPEKIPELETYNRNVIIAHSYYRSMYRSSQRAMQARRTSGGGGRASFGGGGGFSGGGRGGGSR